ncbi:hypothetical protein F5Y18DRAFT_415108 [Xylariaceae sp. FL1019]|nr:hypothetical protein F5Y18DRAFT_415108 [Xylariaceae sp. FL1019]
MAPRQTPTSARKRSRADLEASSPKPASPDPEDQATKPKRARTTLSSRSTPSAFSSVTSAIGGVLGRIGRLRHPVAGAAHASGETLIEPDPEHPDNANIYEVPDSGDEIEHTSKARGSNTSTTATSSTKRLANGLPRSTPGSAQKPKADASTPRRRGRPPKIKGPLESPAVKSRVYGSVGRGRAAAHDPPKLKGILSPQKRKLNTPRKTVLFEDTDRDDTEEEWGRPMPKLRLESAKANRVSSRSKEPSLWPAAENTDKDASVAENGEDAEEAQEEEDEDEDEDEDEVDDEVCAICSKPESKPPNEIIFCEVCDSGFHQACYNVPIIPEGDWICRSCSQEDVVSNGAETSKTLSHSIATVETPENLDIPDIPNFEQHLQRMQRVLLDRCSGNRRIKLRGQDEAFDKAYQLVEQSVLAGEGNSMMVIGGRGCGKTTMMEEIISKLRNENPDDFHVIRLNGFIHTDDKLALKEIWRQLGKEMDIEDDLINKTNNYADTMTSLLALLSHPTEITGSEEEGVTSKSVVFIIDEFELFATHGRQTLLYNLFDIAQARKAPIAVIGLTTRIDVVESLEKRVKSRFSHRYVYLALSKSLVAYWDVCKRGLFVDEEDLESEGLDINLEGFQEFLDYWSKKIDTLRRTPAFEDHLEYYYYTSKSVASFLSSCILPLSALSTSSPNLAIPPPSTTLVFEPPEPKLQLLAALSDLELALLISAARLDIVAHTDTVNFAMAYDEYGAQMGKHRLQSASAGMLALGGGVRTWGRSVAVVAWERLVSLGLLIPAGIGGRSNAAHAGLEGKMWKMDVTLEEIPLAVELPGFLNKMCTQI